MDGDFANILQNNFGLKPSGKNAPMGKTGPATAPSVRPSSMSRPGGMGAGASKNAEPMRSSAPSAFGVPKEDSFFSGGPTPNGTAPMGGSTSMGGADAFGRPTANMDDGLFGGLGSESRPSPSSNYGGDDIFGMGSQSTTAPSSGGFPSDDIFGGPPKPSGGVPSTGADDIFGGPPMPPQGNSAPSNGYDDLLGGFGGVSGSSKPAQSAGGAMDDILGGFAAPGRTPSSGTPAASEPVYDLFGPPPSKGPSPVPTPKGPTRQTSDSTSRTKAAAVAPERTPTPPKTPEAAKQAEPVKPDNIPVAGKPGVVWISVEDIVLLTQPTRASPPVRRPPPVPGDPKVPEVAQRRRSSTTFAEPARTYTPPRTTQPSQESVPQRRSSDGERWTRQGERSGGSTTREPASGTSTPPIDPDFEAAANAAQASQEAMAAALERAAKKRAQRAAAGNETTRQNAVPPRAKAAEPGLMGKGAPRAASRPSYGSKDDMGNAGKKASAANDLAELFGTSKARPASRSATNVNDWGNARSATNVNDWGNAFGINEPVDDAGIEEGDSEERRAAKLAKAQRVMQRQEEALAEKKARDEEVMNEAEERHRCDELYGPDIKRWAAGKEGNLRAMLSTLQFVLWPECGWKAVGVAELVDGNQVKKVYQKAILRIHPDKVQQKGATVHQKYIASKVFDLLKEAYNKFNSSELF